jgi:hypothetical protein
MNGENSTMRAWKAIGPFRAHRFVRAYTRCERRVFQDNSDGTESFGRVDCYKRQAGTKALI